MLSLLVFSQAREIKRLREWAGRAPERAAELEQRVTAAARVQGSRAGQMARQVPRAVTGQPQHLGAVGAQPERTRRPRLPSRRAHRALPRRP